ncbi:thiolase family protein [Saccharopolyspora spinosa]
MIAEAVCAALRDADIDAARVGGVVTEASITPGMAKVADVAAATGMSGLAMTATSSPTGAGILQAVGVAAAVVEAGVADHVVSFFGVDWGSRRSGANDYHAAMDAKSAIERPAGFAGPPLYFATAIRRYAYTYGLRDDEVTDLLSAVAMAARANGRLHPTAQQTKPLTRADYDGSPWIATPLRRADCCLLSDGAAAVVVSNAAAVSARGGLAAVRAWAWAQDEYDDASFYSQSGLPELAAARDASDRTFTKAGLKPQDIDVVELYDCFTPATVLQLESAGFCQPGQALGHVADRALEVGGRHPVNTHGGLLAHGYLLGANHLVEAVEQIRHEAGQRQVSDAALAFVGAGPGRQYTSLVLERQENRE